MNRSLAMLTGAFAAVVLAVPAAFAADESAPMVRIATSEGDFVVALDPVRAPQTVANFVQYVEDGHYDRTIFHRVVSGFVIQGGGFSRYFNERPTRPPVAYEGANGLSNVRGTIAMARTQDPASATAQWYVNLRDNTRLDHLVNDLGVRPGYTVFGRVVEGMDVVDRIGATATGSGGPFPTDVPRAAIVIERAEIIPPSPEPAIAPANP